MDENLKRGFYLGEWEVEPMRGQLVGPSGTAHVEPKVMEVLVALASKPGQVVERNELVDEVWAGRAVSDEPLNRCIAKLRRLLDDSRTDPKFIETVPKRGYRLVAPVKSIMPADAPGDSPETRVRQAWLIRVIAELRHRKVSRKEMVTLGILAIVAILFVSLSARLVLNGDSPGSQDEKGATPSIAVLPFSNLSEGSKNDYFSDGLSEEILNRLTGVNGLTVVARTSSFSFKGSNDDAKTIAKRLAVTHLLNGTVRRDGDRIRISAELVDRDGFRLWSQGYEGILDNIFTLQDTIANDIVAQVGPALPIEDADTPIKTVPPTDDLNAYELVLRGRFHLQRRDEGPLRRSISLFENAIALDDNYGDAYVGLATAYALMPFYSYEPVETAFDFAMTTIEKGARKDPSVDSKAAGIMSFMRYHSEWRWIEAEIGFRRALDYSPNDPELLQWYSQFLGGVGRTEDALHQATRAKQLDGLSPVVNHRLAIVYMWMNENDLARTQYELADELGMEPATNPGAYMILLLRLGKYDDARSLMTGLQTVLGYGTDWIDPVLTAIQEPQYMPAAVEAVARAEQNDGISKQYLFGVWVYLNETDRALDVALELIQDRPSFNAEFLFSEESRALRSNPRFGDLVRAMGLDRYWDNFGWPKMCQREEEQIVCN